MLMQLQIKNLAIVDNISLDFANGMHVITGETGAGKSILLDALGLTLGIRASTNIVGPRSNQAEVAAQFDISELPEVIHWLGEQHLAADECIVRRIIGVDGRSKSYINGHMVTVAQLKELGAKLVNIHSQHQHLALLTASYQRQLLDQYAGNADLVAQVQAAFATLTEYQHEYQQLQLTQQQDNKLQLLNYQIAEIETLNLQADEVGQLQVEHTKLAKADDLLAKIQLLQQILYDNENEYDVIRMLRKAYSYSKDLAKTEPQLQATTDCLQQMIINLEELETELTSYAEARRPDPIRLQQIEQRLSSINQAARKNRVGLEQLSEYYLTLCTERAALLATSEKLALLAEKIEFGQQQYFQAAAKLSASRVQAANKLEQAISAQLWHLDLPNAVFVIKVDSDPQLISSHGTDEVSFQVSTNPGQQPQPLKAIASGGELSRISLSIQVISAEIVQPPTLIFDEVDVGISGKTAEIVGNLLAALGKKAQLVCITHLPQVASKGQHHFKVTKVQTNKTTNTMIQPLQPQERVQEIARLLGGVAITPQAIANAEAMLNLNTVAKIRERKVHVKD